MNFTIRTEREEDYRATENVTREAFWNLYVPGANEHLLLHKLRSSADFVKELCLVAVDTQTNQIIGNIAYTLAHIKDNRAENKTHQVLTFGPLSVLPSWQGKGVASALIKRSFELAAHLGYGAVVIQGYPKFYRHFGFDFSRKFNITDSNGQFPKSLLVKEIRDGSLQNVSGAYCCSPLFDEIDETELQKFDQLFEPKEKFVTPSQKVFEKYCPLKYDEDDPSDIHLAFDNLTRL